MAARRPCSLSDIDTVQIWVDADACPKPIKEVLYRAAERLQIRTTLVANHFLRTPPSKVITAVIVPGGFDVADNHIVEKITAQDLVITADIPLADEVITRGATALNPRGQLYTRENIKEHLTRRDMMEELRSSGAISGGPAALSSRDVHAFAGALDRWLAQRAQ